LPCLSVNAVKDDKVTQTYMVIISFRDSSPDKGATWAAFNFDSKILRDSDGIGGQIGGPYKGRHQKIFSAEPDIPVNQKITFTANNQRMGPNGKAVNCTPSVVSFPIDKEMASIVVDYFGLSKDGKPMCKVTTTVA
jgi:hypothetical protein